MPNVTRLTFSPKVENQLAVERQQRQLAAIQRQKAEVEAFERHFPPLNARTPMPEISWEEVQRQLEALATTRAVRSMVHPLLEELKSRAHWQTPEMVARGLVLLTGLVMDETYAPGETTEPEDEDGGSPML